MGYVKPNLFIIGAMKSGTSSLHEYLGSHPQIYMSKIKEPGYFSECVKYYPQDKKWYMSLFENVSGEKIIGESSTHYSKLPICEGVVEKIWKFNPKARFVYVMRNPIERIISHYWHDVRYLNEHRDMVSAIKSDVEYIAYSDYAYQLRPYISRFGVENVYVMRFENLVNETEHELKKLCKWLGVDEDYSFPNLRIKHNALPKTFYKVRGYGLMYKFRNSGLWNSVSRFVPKKIRAAAAGFTVMEAKKHNEKNDEVIRYLKPVFEEKIENLEILLGQEFDSWK